MKDDDFVIMGDLGEQESGKRKYIVRAWKGDDSFDKEFEAYNSTELVKQIKEAMSNIPKELKDTKSADKPEVHPGHAIDISEVE